MLIDTHCHLNFSTFEKDLPDVVRRAKEAGVVKMIVPGTDLTSSYRAIEIADKFDGIFAAIGIHPHHAQDPNLVVDDKLKTELSKLLTHDRVVAIGEIGLDYYRYTKTKYQNNSLTESIKQKQKDLLHAQLELALIHKKPVILHCRNAYDDMIQTISNFSRIHFPAHNYIKPPQLNGVFHCFSGSKQHLILLITMGYYIGFDGNITYSSDWAEIVSSTPLQRLLLETDSPFLTPIPYRGQRNEPAYLPLVAEAVANYHKTSVTHVMDKTTQNAERLF